MTTLRKVALVIPGFQSSADDWCIPVFTNLSRELSKRVELHVFSLRYPHRRDYYMVGSVHVHTFGGDSPRNIRIPGLRPLRLWREALSAIKNEHATSPFDVVMGIWATESGWLATRAAKMLRLPSLVHLAGGELVYFPEIGYGNLNKGLAGWLVKSTLENAGIVTAPSGPMKRALAGIPHKSRVRLWAPGVDTAMFSPLQHARGEVSPFVFITVGSLIPVKGHELLVRAVGRLRAESSVQPFLLRIVGEGRLKPRLERLVSELGLEGYVIFDGDVSHEVLPSIYRESDTFLLGSWHESQCMAALEAMSCGLPWIGPPVGALADVASMGSDNRSGLLFTSRDPAEVAGAMRAMMTMPYNRHTEMGRKARRIVEDQYQSERQGGKLLQLLADLADESQPG